ncbi:MAG: amidohydrolase [Nitrospirae bacterium CG_4_10_14_3_um_filter_44_29]|nr:MAG: amidohydrolase [Nitrospirae bacterium CG_4_10_14_3_um_filter_44_29]PJA82210.1 MAG: amidohydrolase [Nitrospirae bacterium CG_4_9_14_3_um_filter_44_28]
MIAVKVDLLIKNGIVYDGTGAEPFEADIGVAGDKIAFINKVSGIRYQVSKTGGEKVIDAKGMAVSPGFIDTHSHSEFTLLADPRAEGKISQGITTEINGNCGLSAAPLYREAFKHREKDLAELGIKERWSTFEEYFRILEGRGIALNFVTLAGHGNIRASVIGYKDRKPTVSELKKMRALLQKTIDAGAIGLSTGLIYPPGIYSDTAELIQLCNVLPPPRPPLVRGGWGGGIYTSHMRSEGKGLIESIKEIIRIGEKANIRVHISHIKTSGKENWDKIDEAISLINSAKKRGIKVTCDRYPYTASSTDLDAILPTWAYDGGTEEELRRLRNQKIQGKMRKEILYKHPDKNYWTKVSVSSVSSQKNKWMEGKALSYISRKINKNPVDALFEIIIDEKLRAGAIFSTMSEENLRRFLSLPFAMIGSDSSARSMSGITYDGKPHPRGFGSFPRFLGKYVRDEGLMNMSEAIHKITMLPARTFGINGRGVLKKGAFADIVVFDSESIIDRATFDKPFLKSEGIHYVVVNGTPAVWKGKFTGSRSGRVLR